MRILCISPDADRYDLYVYAVSRNRLVRGQGYDVNNALGKRMLEAHPGLFAADTENFSLPDAVSAPSPLQQIRGIGPMIANALNEQGIFTLAQLLAADAEALDRSLDGSSLAQILRWKIAATHLESEK